MSVGLGLLQKVVIENRPLSFLTENGIDSDSFESEEQKVFEFIYEHVRRHGRMPKVSTVEQEIEVEFHDFPDEPMGYWLQSLIRRNRTDAMLEATKEVRESINEDNIDEAQERFVQAAVELQKRFSPDKILTLSGLSDEVVNLHDQRQRAEIMAGVPFGFSYLDQVSDGAQPTDTVALAGRPGVGKSYILFRMSVSAYEKGEIPLIMNMEMSPTQCARRIVALKSGLSATRVRLGKLSHWQRKKLQKEVRTIHEEGERPFYIMQGSLNSTVEDLALHVQELKPTVLYIDGAYLMQTRTRHRARWERVAEVAEYQKMIAREFNIPAIATWQFNKKGPGSVGNIMYSDTIGQLASIVCGIDDEKGKGKAVWSARTFKRLMLLKGREGEKGILRVLYDMEKMLIEQDSVISGYQMEKEDNGV